MKIPMLGSGLLYLVNRDRELIRAKLEFRKALWMAAGGLASAIVIIWNLLR